MKHLNVLTVTLSGTVEDYFHVTNDSRVNSRAWFNEDESLCIHFLNNRWVISEAPFDEQSIISEYPDNNWPQITIKKNNQ